MPISSRDFKLKSPDQHTTTELKHCFGIFQMIHSWFYNIEYLYYAL